MGSRSVIQPVSRNCYLCGKPSTCTHHIIGGLAYRKKSDKYGFTVRLCDECHRFVHANINSGFSLMLRQECQRYYEENIGTREDFIREFGKSRL